MYALRLNNGKFLSFNGKVIWFEYKIAVRDLAELYEGTVVNRNDFNYCI